MNYIILALLTVLTILKSYGDAIIPEGEGTANSPYLITSTENIQWISENSDSWDKFFTQTTDIIYIFQESAPFTPIGGENNISFSGTYDGCGHSIRNVSYFSNTSNYQAFFSETDNATIKNLALLDVRFTGIGGVDSLVALTRNSTTIENCYTTGEVEATSYGNVGGLVAIDNGSTIKNCYTSVNVKAVQNVCGGLVGSIDNTTIINCYSTGKVETTGTEDFGGLIGIGYFSTITNSYWNTETSEQSTSQGGEGKTTAEMKNIATYIGWDFTNETVNGTDDFWSINSYDNDGYPFLSWQNYGIEPIGNGTEGEPYQIATLQNLFWISIHDFSWDKYFEQIADINASETSDWDFGKGFSPIGLNYDNNFTGTYNGNNYSITGMYINRPESENNTGLFGRAKEGLIENLAVLDVDITGNSSVGGLIGSNSSNVTNCYSTGTVSGKENIGGLIGFNVDFIVIKNCHNSADVTGLGDYSYYIGGLIGSNDAYSEIKNCYNSGNVTGYQEVGGLMGYNGGDVLINCYNTGNVTGTQAVGGLIGQIQPVDIQKCYNMGIVSGSGDHVGGLIGQNYGTDNIIDCFWDTETSDQDASEGGTGKTTSEMKDITTFTDAGWDFINETVNGTNDIWVISDTENNGYPYFNINLNTDIIIAETLVSKSKLYQNYPNPFNTKTTISYYLEENTNVTIAIYNAIGRKIAILVNEKQNAGKYYLKLNTSNYSNGAYYIKMQTNKTSQNIKTMLIK